MSEASVPRTRTGGGGVPDRKVDHMPVAGAIVFDLPCSVAGLLGLGPHGQDG
jgi:hypothetical protein